MNDPEHNRGPTPREINAFNHPEKDLEFAIDHFHLPSNRDMLVKTQGDLDVADKEERQRLREEELKRK